MNYICNTGDDKLDAMLRVLLERFRSTAPEKGLLLVTEHPQEADEGVTALLMLYADDRYLRSPEHRRLSERFGESYRAVARPVDLAEFCRVVRELHGLGDGMPPSRTGEENGSRVSYENRTVSFRGRTVRLTAREDELFRLMYEHRGRVVTREHIASAVWGSNASANVTDVYMSYLRRKLVSVFGEGVLSSVRGEGYILNLPADGEMPDKG
ncbi:MAG: winged-helix domain-containing protein [Eubacteriales bacterium]